MFLRFAFSILEKTCAAIKTLDISNSLMHNNSMMYTIHFTNLESADAEFAHFHDVFDHLRTHNFTATVKRDGRVIATWSPSDGLDMSYFIPMDMESFENVQ